MTKEEKRVKGQGEGEGESRGGLQSLSPTQLTQNVAFELNNETENPPINGCVGYAGSAQAEMGSGRRGKS
jgi:hypothetical protein